MFKALFVFAVVLATLAAFVAAVPDPRAAPIPAARALPSANPQYYYGGYYGYPAVAYYG